jgi:hypothetical protein
MTESEFYWFRLFDELVAITRPLRGDSALEDEPAWVVKITAELCNMITPKMQLRAGMKPTPDKVGVIMGSHLVQMAQAEALSKLPKPTTQPGLAALNMGTRLGTLSEALISRGHSKMYRRSEISSVRRLRGF